MSEKGFTGVFLGALLVGVVATLGVYRLLVERGVISRGDAVVTVPVVVAAENIPEGTMLHAPDLRVKRSTMEALPEGAFAEIDSVVGRVVRIPIFKGESVLENKLAPVGAAAGLAVKIQPGYRAMAIPVNDHAGISGLILPNSRVDVLVTLRPQRGRNERVSKLFLQNMRVLSVGQELRSDEDGKPITAKTVTLEVTPEEAELLAVAMNEGVLHLALRGFSDSDSTKTTGATPRGVLASANRRTGRVTRSRPTPPPRQPVVDEPAWMKVQIFRGSEMTEQTVELHEDSAATKRNPDQKPSADKRKGS